MKPRLLDLFSGAGGAGMGYSLAGFDVTGVDCAPQKRYPFAFIQADALEYIAAHGHEYDAIHASPVCKGYSTLSALWPGRDYPDQVASVRALLQGTGKPYVIENVLGAPLQNPTELCGLMFGLRLYRHRRFETSFPLALLLHPPHHARVTKAGRPIGEGQIMTVVGHFSGVSHAQAAMGINWMSRAELSQAIPPAYTKWIGEQLLAALGGDPGLLLREGE